MNMKHRAVRTVVSVPVLQQKLADQFFQDTDIQHMLIRLECKNQLFSGIYAVLFIQFNFLNGFLTILCLLHHSQVLPIILLACPDIQYNEIRLNISIS